MHHLREFLDTLDVNGDGTFTIADVTVWAVAFGSTWGLWKFIVKGIFLKIRETFKYFMDFMVAVINLSLLMSTSDDGITFKDALVKVIAEDKEFRIWKDEFSVWQRSVNDWQHNHQSQSEIDHEALMRLLNAQGNADGLTKDG